MSIISIPVHNARFPGRCVRCGRAPSTESNVLCRSGVDLILFRVAYQANLPVPTCPRCAGWHRRARVAAVVGSIVVIFTFMFLMFGAEPSDPSKGDRDTWLWFLLGGHVILLYIARNLVRPSVDLLTLGVMGRSLNARGIARVEFRNDQLAEDIREATDRAEAGRVDG